MTFTYESPPTLDKDKVRFWSTDTVERAYSVSDEDILFLLTEYPDQVMQVAAMVADRIAGYWSVNEAASGSDKKVGPFAVGQRTGGDLEAAWRALAARLRAGNSIGLPTMTAPVFTGDEVPEFSIGMMDNGLQNYPDRSAAVRPANGVW